MKTEQKTQSNKISPLTSETIAISHRSIPEFEESPRWVRTMFGGETIADSTRVMVLRRANRLPVYCFPKEDVRMDLMEKTQHRSEFPPQGTATYWSIKVGDKMAENAAWSFLDPTDAWQTLKDYMIFEWGKMDAWYEEEDIPREDIRMDFLEPSDLKTRCPYKGIASSYWSIKVGDKKLENSVWSYRDPLPEAYKIKDYLCSYNERVDAIYVNNELVPKPNTPWS